MNPVQRRLLIFLIAAEAQEAGESVLDGLKQRVFASAFGSWNPGAALKEYYKIFEDPEPGPDFDNVEEWEPEGEDDVMSMINTARRAGVIT